MVSKIIFVLNYTPNSASANRIFALAGEFASLNIDVVIILCSRKDFIVPEFETVKITRIVSSGIDVYMRIMREIKALYTIDTIIYTYDNPIICAFLPKHFNIFCEYTEIPNYGRRNTLISIIKSQIKLFFTRRTKGLFVITNGLKHYYEQHGFKHIEVLNMFVDQSRFVQSTNKNNYYIAYCGTVSEYKDGVDYLLKAFDLFHNSHPQYTLKIIGRFESETSRHNLLSLTSTLRCSKSVEYVGEVASDDMPDYLTNATILALARPDNIQAKFGFPTKLGEYLATGRPVIVTDVGEINQYLSDSLNCYMVSPNDCIAFAKKMEWIVDNYDQALGVGSRGKELCNSCFSVKTQASKALDFINNIVE